MVLEDVLKWAILVFMGGFLIFAIQNFVKRMQELAVLFQDLRHTVNELKLMLFNNQERYIERERTVNLHLEKHDRYIKDLWKSSNEHGTDIKLIKKDIEAIKKETT